MATVLIIATDPTIGGLLGQLADLAGHAVQFRRHDEQAGEAVRRSRADVVMLDAGYDRATIEAIAGAAAEVGVPVVYFASTLSANELRRFAAERGAKYFALPAGPKLLRRVLSSALGGESPAVGDPWSGQHAVTAAVVAVARARVLADRAADVGTESRGQRGEHEAMLADCRRSYAALREAVIAYTRELRGAGMPPERALEMVKAAVASDGTGARATADIARAMDDAVEWCLQAYYVA